MYAVAGAAGPRTATCALARAVYAEMALAGITCVGEFHYLHHGPDGDAVRRPERDGRARWSRPPRDAGIRITLLDTCYLTAAGVGRRRRWPGRSCGSATATPARGRSGSTALRPDAGARAGRRGDPLGAGGAGRADARPWSAGRTGTARRCTCTCPSSRAENDACLAAYGCTPAAAAGRARACSARAPPRARHPPDRATTSTLLGDAGTGVCLCPTTERGPRRRDRPGPGRWPTPGCPLSLGSDSHAVIDLFEEARAVELDERLAHRAARPLRRRPSCSAPRPCAGHACAGLGRRRADRRRRAGRPGHRRLDSRGCAGRGSRDGRWTAWSSRPPPPTSAHVRGRTAGPWSATVGTCRRAMSRRALAAATVPAGGRRMSGA